MVFDILNFLGDTLFWFCFLIPGFALGRFTLDAYVRATGWQLQAALVLGFFLLLAAVVNYAPDGLAAAFALGAGLAFLRDLFPKEEKP